jgi:LysM repeat protein
MAMDTAERRSPLRILAPVALIVFALALVLIISSTGGGGGGSGGTSSSSAEKARDLGSGSSTKSKSKSSRDKLPRSIYVVKTGDTLGSISQKVGVSVSKLQELNPNLDQFSLVAGQKIKIR